MKTKLLALAAAGVLASGCSTIANGKHQGVDFATVDASGTAIEGADCRVTGGRDGAVDVEFTTPAEDVQIRRAKAAIDVECAKDGYETARRTVESKMEGSTGGNVVAGGFVGLGVDAMTGAMFKYPGTIMMTMERVGAVADKMMDKMDGTASMGEPVAK